VKVEVEGRSEALDQRYRAGCAFLEWVPSLVDQAGGDRPVNDAAACHSNSAEKRHSYSVTAIFKAAHYLPIQTTFSQSFIYTLTYIY